VIRDVGTLTIANGGTESNALTGVEDAVAVTIAAPSALTGTVTIQIATESTGTSFVDLTSGGSDVTIGAANSVTITPVCFRQVRVKSGSAEGAERAFTVVKRIFQG
jgi:hypothetical protein